MWPERAKLLRDAGILGYRISCNEDTGRLFVLMHLAETHVVDALPGREQVQRRWAYGRQHENSPRRRAARPVFMLTKEGNDASR
ncbi:L-rhamnose mutarotase [Salinisphaera sp.]|uniref:L-rhamnose mutarotase n=1 Tax=Salinisphaera sp. TaxID=1914330 RepID=UPI003C7AB2C3